MDLLSSAAIMRSAPAAAKPKTDGLSKQELKWLKNYNLLKLYLQQEGNTRVPRNYTVAGCRLGLWVTNQRMAYKRMKEGNSRRMTEERVRLLEDIGFEWVLRHTEFEWDDWFELLGQYYEEHHHVRVPVRYQTFDGIKLGIWVMTQRAVYKKTIKGGKTTSLTPDRIKLLNSIGFEWDAKEAEWMDWFELLSQYHAEHGHCRVPAAYMVGDKRLGVWIQNQRTLCRRTFQGSSGAMTEKRINLLRSLDFFANTSLMEEDSSKKEQSIGEGQQADPEQVAKAPALPQAESSEKPTAEKSPSAEHSEKPCATAPAQREFVTGGSTSI